MRRITTRGNELLVAWTEADNGTQRLRTARALPPPARVRPWPTTLPPSLPVVRIHAEHELADDLTRQRRVGRMEPPGSRIAEETFELAFLEHPESARDVHGAVDDAPHTLDGPIFRRDDFDRPVGMLHA